MNFNALLAFSVVATLSTASAVAAPLFTGSYPGAHESPGSTSFSFDSAATPASLSFELAGYLSLDGNNPTWTDTFTLAVNGVNVFSGMFNMGGGGFNQVTLAPAGTNWSTYTNNCTPDPYNCTTIPYVGGKTEVTLPITLAAGTNTLSFSYAGTAQGIADEGWGINSLTVTAVPEPETYAMLLAGLGLLGGVARRRQRAP
jgi:hypothetical protein